MNIRKNFHPKFLKNVAIILTSIATVTSCQTTGDELYATSWGKTFFCASALIDANYTGPKLQKRTNSCIVVELGKFLLFYSPTNVVIKNSKDIFSEDEIKFCQVAQSKKPTNLYLKSQRNMRVILKKQFNLEALNPLAYEAALLEYNMNFKKLLPLCLASDLENKNLKEFHIKISKIQNHEKSLSLARKKIHPFLKSRYTLKTVKKLSDYLWRIRVKIAIVNNSTVPYEFAQTCNTSNMYTSTTRGVKIYTETCGNSKIEISRISPKGVFRDEIDILIRSKDRPTGQEVSLYFGGAPSLHLGTIIIPPSKSS